MAKKVMVISILVSLIIVLSVIALFSYNSDFQKRSSLIGDGICGNYINQEERDSCCAVSHEGQESVDCVGNWRYFEEGECKFVCDSKTEEVDRCISAGGIWRTFNNACADFCVNSGEDIFCAQVFTDGCDCGADKCWNGERCE